MTNDIERGALYGLRSALAGFLDDRVSTPHFRMSSPLNETSQMQNAAFHLSEAIRWIKCLEEQLLWVDE